MIPPTQLASWLVAVNWLSICCKNKEINFFQDIGDTTSFDLELVTKDCINNDQIIMAVLQETRRKSNFFITFGCLVSADQPTINYKGRLRRKLTQTLIFPKSSVYVSVANGFAMEKSKYETYKQDTLSMSNAIKQSAKSLDQRWKKSFKTAVAISNVIVTNIYFHELMLWFKLVTLLFFV